MTGVEVRTARERLGLDVAGLAAELGVTPHVVEAWEAGTVAVPKAYAGELAWRVAAVERDEALATSGLPECPTVRELELALESDPSLGDKEQLKIMEALFKHAEQCPNCKARERYQYERFGPMPARPVTGFTGFIGRVAEQVERLPPWARPIAWGALLFVAMSAVRVLLSAPRLAQQPRGWLIALGGLGASAAIGAGLGGLVSLYRFVQQRARSEGSPLSSGVRPPPSRPTGHGDPLMSAYADRLNATRARYPFQRWKESGLEQYTAEACAAFAAVFDRLIVELAQIGPDAAEPVKLAAFEKAVVALNALNAADESLIETGQREDLCELINTITVAAGLDPSRYGGGEGPASEWREW